MQEGGRKGDGEEETHHWVGENEDRAVDREVHPGDRPHVEDRHSLHAGAAGNSGRADSSEQ
eukprot:5786626-Amphidinium_carterae.1